jgi:hypothetical protein
LSGYLRNKTSNKASNNRRDRRKYRVRELHKRLSELQKSTIVEALSVQRERFARSNFFHVLLSHSRSEHGCALRSR